MSNLWTIVSVAGASFAASFVKAVEALTVRFWRSVLPAAGGRR